MADGVEGKATQPPLSMEWLDLISVRAAHVFSTVGPSLRPILSVCFVKLCLSNASPAARSLHVASVYNLPTHWVVTIILYRAIPASTAAAAAPRLWRLIVLGRLAVILLEALWERHNVSSWQRPSGRAAGVVGIVVELDLDAPLCTGGRLRDLW